jgi:hypothetical protein
MCQSKTSSGTKPAVLGIGKERASAKAASQRADAESSWNMLEGGVLNSFRRLGRSRLQLDWIKGR